jgi:hypothetical protein
VRKAEFSIIMVTGSVSLLGSDVDGLGPDTMD